MGGIGEHFGSKLIGLWEHFGSKLGLVVCILGSLGPMLDHIHSKLMVLGPSWLQVWGYLGFLGSELETLGVMLLAPFWW